MELKVKLRTEINSEIYGSRGQYMVMIVQENVATKNVRFCTLIQRRKLESVHGTTEDFADMVKVFSVCRTLIFLYICERHSETFQPNLCVWQINHITITFQ